MNSSLILFFSALAAMTVNNQPNVFWYNETDSYIYRYDGSAVNKHMMWHAPGAIVSFLGYTKDLCKKYIT